MVWVFRNLVWLYPVGVVVAFVVGAAVGELLWRRAGRAAEKELGR